jgi:hypothetical protein
MPAAWQDLAVLHVDHSQAEHQATSIKYFDLKKSSS